MKQSKAQLTSLLSLLEKRGNLFYILAFAPLLIIFYFGSLGAIVPFYGFVLLLLKRQKLLDVEEASLIQKILGVTVMAGSFFVYYVVVLVFLDAAFYGVANYVVYLLGLFLIFFEFPTLKEAFTPFFLIVAATSSSFISVWLKPYLSPFTNDFAHIILSILRALGMNANLNYYGGIPVLTLSSLSGKTVGGAFVYECIGVQSVLIFSIILILILFEDPSGSKVKIVFSIVGLLGTFALNIVRVTIIFLTDYFYGTTVGGTVHYVIGYALFSAWLAFFFYIYSKRQTLNARIISFWKKLH